MKKNVGSIDKVVRILLALVAAYLGWKGGFSDTVSYILFAVAIILLVVSLIGFCPLYPLLGISTCKSKKE